MRVKGNAQASFSWHGAGHVQIHTINTSRRSQLWSDPILAFISRSRHYSFTMTFTVSMPLLAVKELGQSCGLV